MKKFRLIKPIKTKTRIEVATRQNGRLKLVFMDIMPNKEYELPDDPTFVKSLCSTQFKKNYDKQLEQAFQILKIPYEVKVCKSCGGGVKKIVYCPIEVIDE